MTDTGRSRCGERGHDLPNCGTTIIIPNPPAPGERAGMPLKEGRVRSLLARLGAVTLLRVPEPCAACGSRNLWRAKQWGVVPDAPDPRPPRSEDDPRQGAPTTKEK